MNKHVASEAPLAALPREGFTYIIKKQINDLDNAAFINTPLTCLGLFRNIY